MQKILITGASGFIGQRFLKTESESFQIKTVSLQKTEVEEIDFSGIVSVVHLAGIAHRMDMPSGKIYYDVNAHLTEKLANKAKSEKVPHFIFVSTVKVYGESYSDDFLDETSECNPEDDYGKSKLTGERLVRGLEDENFKVAVVRPPLVYGPRVKGNMLTLMNIVKKFPFLPLGGIKNLRSMVFVDNLNALIKTIIHQKASGIFIAGDENPISTSTLIDLIYRGTGKSNRSFPFPSFARKIIRLIKPAIFNRIFGSFVIDNQKTNEKLNFKPPYSTEYGIRKMVLGD